jgi:alpha-beta hydrolase superfamily lysophospholipase
MFDFGDLFKCEKPRLLVSGGRDDFTPAERFTEFCGKLPESKEFAIVEGADHFWLGYEGEAGDRVAAFFKDWL